MYDQRRIIPYHPERCLPVILVLAIALLLFAPDRLFAQSTTPVAAPVKGRVRDTLLNKDCPLATIAILKADRSLLQSRRSKKDGSFLFEAVPAGKYRILIMHPTYSDYEAPLIITDTTGLDLGVLFLLPKADTLTAVIVTPHDIPPRMRGDTLEFNAAAVKLRANASVEELLKRLPGVQIDQNGGITVNGQKAQHLLVDGEDFFGGSPAIVTRNFNADMIAKVQVLDKKSQQSEFTGIDDGQRTKTVNLTLKEESKRGYFGKVEAGGDPQGIYNSNAMLGALKVRRQFAALGIAANTGNTGFSGTVGDLGSGLNIDGGTNDALGASAGTGIPRVIGGGVHYANAWNGKEDHFLGNYQYGHLVTHPISSSIVEQTLPDSIYVQQQQSSSVNSQEQHAFTADYNYAPDSVSDYHLALGGGDMRGHNDFQSTGSSSFNDTLVNNSLRTIKSDVQSSYFRSSVLWHLRSRKKVGRMVSVVAIITENDNTTNGFLYSLNHFFRPDSSLLSSDTTDQRKVITNKGLYFYSSLNYVEPLWKDAVLALGYGLSINNSRSQQSTYNRGDGKYDAYVDSFSNHYQDNTLNQRITANLQFHNQALTYTIGGDLLQDGYRQADLLAGTRLHYQYLTFAPRVSTQYNLNPFRGFSFDYSGSTQQPYITQLQPVQNNNDPLHIVIGNPNLHPSFTHNFGIAYHDLKPSVLNIGLNYSVTTNSISNRTYTDKLGRQISQAVNTNGSENAGLNFSISRQVLPIKLDMGFTTNGSYTRSVNYVDTLLSNNDSYNTGFGLSIGKYVSDKYSFRINTTAGYSYSRSSINTGAATRYWTQNHTAELSAFPLTGLEINTSGNYTWRQRTSIFDKDNSTMLWNAYINKDLLNNRLAIRWQVNNILDQNAGISRSISTNMSSENRNNTIGRYWLVSVIFHFVNRRKEN